MHSVNYITGNALRVLVSDRGETARKQLECGSAGKLDNARAGLGELQFSPGRTRQNGKVSDYIRGHGLGIELSIIELVRMGHIERTAGIIKRCSRCMARRVRPSRAIFIYHRGALNNNRDYALPFALEKSSRSTVWPTIDFHCALRWRPRRTTIRYFRLMNGASITIHLQESE